MKKNRKILVLYSSNDEPVVARQLADSITHLGSTAIIRKMGDGQYDQILDAVEIVDTVIYWPPD